MNQDCSPANVLIAVETTSIQYNEQVVSQMWSEEITALAEIYENAMSTGRFAGGVKFDVISFTQLSIFRETLAQRRA